MEIQNCLCDPFEIFERQFRIHGQGNHLGAGLFCLGKTSGGLAEVAIGLLEVDRHGIVEARADATLVKMLLKVIASS